MVRKHLSRFGLSSQRQLWGSESSFKSPALRHPIINLMDRHAIFTTPLSNCLGFIPESLKSIPASIITLLYCIYPPTVIRFVITIIINSIKLVGACRLFAHIPEKSLKPSLLVSPLCTNHYTPTTVPPVVNVTRGITPIFHPPKGVVLILMKFREFRLAHLVNSIGCFYV